MSATRTRSGVAHRSAPSWLAASGRVGAPAIPPRSPAGSSTVFVRARLPAARAAAEVVPAIERGDRGAVARRADLGLGAAVRALGAATDVEARDADGDDHEEDGEVGDDRQRFHVPGSP